MIRQISVFVENQPGSMMNVTSVLTEEHVNIRAISTFDSPEFGIMRLVVDDPVRAKESLTKRGFVTRVTEVIGAELKDEKGNLNQMLKILADGQINVTAAADLYTESSNTGSYIDMDYPSYEETPDAVSTNELYTTASGDTWQMITTTSQGDDFNDSIDAYRTEDTILYGIHIGYPSNLKESAQAELKKILENGIGQN